MPDARVESRYTQDSPCSICAGWERQPRGNGKRCHGYAVVGGGVYCSQVESDLPNSNGLFWHARPDDNGCAMSAERVHDDGPRPWDNSDWDRIYTYRDESGKTLFQVLRRDFAPGDKTFSQRRPDPAKAGEHLFNLNGVRRVPYRLPELIQALDEDGETKLVIAEGEKACETLVDQGLVATCIPGGASGWNAARQVCLPILRRFAHVTVFRDNDDQGLKFAQQLKADLEPECEVSIVKSATDGDGDDAVEHFEAGFGVTEFRTDEETEIPAQPACAKVWHWNEDWPETGPPQYRIDRLVLQNGINILAGPSKAGKTWHLIHWTICIVRGEPVYGLYETLPGRVLFLEAETDPRTMKQRFDSLAGGQPLPSQSLAWIQRNEAHRFKLDTLKGRGELLKVVEETGAEVLILDPIRRFWTGAEREDDKVAAIIAFLQELQRDGLDVIYGHHTTKMGESGRNILNDSNLWLEKVRGSGDFVAGADSVVFLMKERAADRLIRCRMASEGRALGMSNTAVELQFDTEGRGVFHVSQVEPRDMKRERAGRMVDQAGCAVELLRSKGEIDSGREFKAALQAKYPGMTRAAAEDAIALAVFEERIIEKPYGKGNGTTYRLPE